MRADAGHLGHHDHRRTGACEVNLLRDAVERNLAHREIVERIVLVQASHRPSPLPIAPISVHYMDSAYSAGSNFATQIEAMTDQRSVRRSPVAMRHCNLSKSFELIGDRWTLL